MKKQTGLMGNATDYSRYKMNGNEKLLGFLQGFTLVLLFSNVILHKWLVAFAVGLVGGVFYLKKYKEKCREKQNALLLNQFKELMESLVTSYSSGGNHVQAFENAYRDMRDLYGEDGLITKEIRLINTGIRNGLTIESLIKDFAERTDIEDIKNFADVFSVSIRQGGDMKKVLHNTRVTIIEKLEMENDIAVQLRASNNEFVILTAIPVIVDLFMQFDYSMMMAGQTSVGVIARTIAVAFCIIAYKLGKKVTSRVEKLFT